MPNPETKHLIWSSEPVFEEWKQSLEADYPDCSEDELTRIMYDLNNDYLDDEKTNLKHLVPSNGILAIGIIGTWRGNRQGVMEHDPVSVPDCMRSYCTGDSEVKFYVDEKGEFCGEEIHHDGRNHYRFRAWRPDVTEEQKEYLRVKAKMGRDCTNSIKRLTYRLGDLIGDVYGWNFPNRPKCSKPIPVD